MRSRKLNINYWFLPGLGNLAEINISAGAIVDIVCDHFNISRDRIHARSRKRDVSTTRQIIAFLLKENVSKMTSSQIASYMGSRDHTTALYAIRKIGELSTVDFEVRIAVKEIRQKIVDLKLKQAA